MQSKKSTILYIIKQRFRLVLDYKPRQWTRIALCTMICIVIILSLLLSYMFVLQPAYEVDESQEPGTFEITPDTSYLIPNGDGTFAIYSDGLFRGNLEDINTEPFSLLPIRKTGSEKGEYHEVQ